VGWQADLVKDLERRGRIAPSGDYPTIPTAHLEHYFTPSPQKPDAAQEADKRCRIRVHSRLHRLGDIGGRSDKAAIDGIVAGGLLPDDGPEMVSEITHSQERCGPDEDEETVITIAWGP
jgi:hypothetical protein